MRASIDTAALDEAVRQHDAMLNTARWVKRHGYDLVRDFPMWRLIFWQLWGRSIIAEYRRIVAAKAREAA
jgi:hypothetical protein